jgi:molecular chaperone GrpE
VRRGFRANRELRPAGYVARALARRARTRPDGPELPGEPTGPAEDSAGTGTDEQPKRSKRQVDDDQVNNDSSRAPEPDNLTGAQAEVEPKPGATKTEAAPRADAGGKDRTEPSAPDKGEQAAADSEGGKGAEAIEQAAKVAKASQAEPKAAEPEGAERTADEGQPATPADAAAGEAATAPAGESADEGDADTTSREGAKAEAAPSQRDAEAAPSRPRDAAAEADAGRPDAEAEADASAEPAAADAGEEAEAPDGAERPAATVEEEPSEAVLAELVSARAEAEGYLDDLRRLQAEFDNYRKRTMREQTARIASASQALVSRLLPVLDNFELAVSHAEQSRDFDRMLKGVEMVFGELNDVLAGEGLVAIEASGKPFDPERHEAVVAVEEDGVEAGTVVDVIRKGYEFNGRVLRPAMVKVAR